MREGDADVFVWPVRIYYEDTDCGGVVYHANYLRFLERARTEWLRQAGHSQGRLRRELGLLFAVRRLEIDYRQPAFYDDELLILTRVRRGGHARLDFVQQIQRHLSADDDQAGAQEICRARVNVVAIGADDKRPRRIPKDILREIHH